MINFYEIKYFNLHVRGEIITAFYWTFKRAAPEEERKKKMLFHFHMWIHTIYRLIPNLYEKKM